TNCKQMAAVRHRMAVAAASQMGPVSATAVPAIARSMQTEMGRAPAVPRRANSMLRREIPANGHKQPTLNKHVMLSGGKRPFVQAPSPT
ncbi:MAG: hypothetical protein KC419_09085, partial [Anaerolineales bacterium]|nr:hypothetical protein [Anaerolineales bacterium]